MYPSGFTKTMTLPSIPVRYENHLAIGHPDRHRVLVLPTADGWRLPAFVEAERHFWQEIGHINNWMAEHLGIAATTLRCLAINYTPDDEVLSKVYAAVLKERVPVLPHEASWVSAEEVLTLPLAVEEHRTALVDWFAWYSASATPAPALRTPWYMPGWYDAAVAWANHTLHKHQMRLTGQPIQLRSWQRSAIVRLPTDQGAAYLKVVPPVAHYEPALTTVLASLTPHRVARPIALDQQHGRLLMHEVQGTSLMRYRDDDDLALWQQALAEFATLQIATTSHLGDLRATGLPTRSLAELEHHVLALLHDLPATLPNRPAGLSRHERERLRRLAGQLSRRWEALQSDGIPLALEHGDFWAGQVLINQDTFVFLDWADSSLSHPFFSLLLFLVESEDFLPHIPHVRERLRDAYLEPWTSVVPGVNLVRAFEQTQLLAALQQAVYYHAVVLPSLEVKWELELMPPFYLKMALRLSESEG